MLHGGAVLYNRVLNQQELVIQIHRGSDLDVQIGVQICLGGSDLGIPILASIRRLRDTSEPELSTHVEGSGSQSPIPCHDKINLPFPPIRKMLLNVL